MNANLHRVLKKYDHLVMDSMTETLDLNTSVKLSLNILSELRNIVKNDVIYIMFSGGKDSLVLLDLTLRVFHKEQVKVLFIEVTDNTHEENIDYVYKVVRAYYEFPKENFVHLRRELRFYDAVIRWGWPGPRRRWCMNEFKRLLLSKYFKKKHLDKPIVLVGTKVRDSKRRLKLFLQKGILFNSYWWNYAARPLAHFSTLHIHEYIQRNNLPLCSLYHKLGESGNCVYCPFIMKRNYYLNLYRLYPKWMYKIIKAELKVKKGTPFIISQKKIGFRDILGDELYNQILKELK